MKYKCTNLIDSRTY